MIGQAEVFIAEGIDIGWFFLSAAGPGMLEHAFHNGFGTFTVVVDFSGFSRISRAMSTAEPGCQISIQLPALQRVLCLLRKNY